MIEKYLTSEDYENKFKELNVNKQLVSLKTCNAIEKEDTSFIVVLDISEKYGADLCSISKMQYVQGTMTWISSETF